MSSAIRSFFRGNATNLWMRIAFKDPDAPLPDPALVKSHPLAVKNLLETLMRAWEADRFASYRITERLPRLAFPVILIQKVDSEPRQVHSRSPGSGEAIDFRNFDSGLVNSVPRLTPTLLRSLKAAEQLLRMPITFSVTSKRSGPFSILGIEPSLLLTEYLLRAKLDLMDEGVISPSSVLRGIKPEMLISRYDLDCEPPFLLLRGVFASTGSSPIIAAPIVIGRGRATDGKILVLSAGASPEDTPALITCSGVIDLRGGVSGHAALACRSHGIPCVVGISDVYMDFERRILLGPCGQEIPQNTICVMDARGLKICFALGGPQSIKAKPVCSVATSELLPRLRALVAVCFRKSVASKLSRQSQENLLLLHNMLSELGRYADLGR